MKTTNRSSLRPFLYTVAISMLIAIPVLATWASTFTQEEVKVWKMWINLAISGYAEPMPMKPTDDKPVWKVWE